MLSIKGGNTRERGSSDSILFEMTSELPGQDALVPEMKCDSIKMCDLWKEPTWFLEYVVLDLFVGNKVMRTRFRPYDVSLKSKTQ